MRPSWKMADTGALVPLGNPCYTPNSRCFNSQQQSCNALYCSDYRLLRYFKQSVNQAPFWKMAGTGALPPLGNSRYITYIPSCSALILYNKGR